MAPPYVTPSVTTGGPATGHSYKIDLSKPKEKLFLVEGLTIRDHFAMAALQGMIAVGCATCPPTLSSSDEDAAKAYAFADSMLDARS